jgi:YjbE family integral membrane protein
VDLASSSFWLAALEIVVINILLSGDNAVVIALACRNLPGRQRTFGIVLGAAGAIVLRIVLTFFAVQLLGLPWLKLVGGVLLLWIGIKLIAEEDGEGEDEDGKIAASDRLWGAVRTVVVADLVMSIDNVLGVAAAAKGSLLLLVFGLVVSIPLVIAGSQVILKLIERFPVLILAGGGLLGWVAGEMMVEDAAIAPWIGAHAHWLVWAAPVAGVLVVIGVAKALQRRSAAPHN